MNDNGNTFRTGAQLLSEWGCKSREQRLERACAALMEQLNEIHKNHHGQNLFEHLTAHYVDCSCADASRMGFEAIKGSPLEVEIRQRNAANAS
jgi:hypothetical protein